MDDYFREQIDTQAKNTQEEIESLNLQISKYKVELSELAIFSQQKQEIDDQLKQFKILLEKKEHEYRDTIHGLERKVLQDKARILINIRVQ